MFASVELFILYGTLKLQIESTALCSVLLFNLKVFEFSDVSQNIHKDGFWQLLM